MFPMRYKTLLMVTGDRISGGCRLTIEGTQIQDRNLSLEQVRLTLRPNGVPDRVVESFLDDLDAKGHAELRQPLISRGFFFMG
jgi:hypothetical protein